MILPLAIVALVASCRGEEYFHPETGYIANGLGGYRVLGGPEPPSSVCHSNDRCPFNKSCIDGECENPCTGFCGSGAECHVSDHRPVCTCPPETTGHPYLNCQKLKDKELKTKSVSKFPYQVFIEKKQKFVCNGAIISNFYVLTPAHCIQGNTSELNIRSGTNIMNSGGIIHRIEDVIVHEKFSKNEYKYDVALIKVKKQFVFDNFRQRILLFRSSEKATQGEEAFATVAENVNNFGFNTTNFRKINWSILGNSSCGDVFQDFGEGQICAEKNDDSETKLLKIYPGTPLVIEERLAGVHLYGESPDTEGVVPEVFSDVTPFRDWIFDQIIESL